MIKTEPVKFVERSHVGKDFVALVRDLLLTDQLLLRPRQLAAVKPSLDSFRISSSKACFTGSIFSGSVPR